MGIAVGSENAIFVSGTVTDNSSNSSITPSHWITRRSLDQGASWTTVDDYLANPNFNQGSSARAIAITSTGTIFVGGVPQWQGYQLEVW